MELLTGQFNKHIRGFGFVKTGLEELPEIFIGKESVKGAMNGDLVAVDLLPEYLWDERPSGIITKIIERATTNVVGTLQARKGFGFVVPDEKAVKDDIFVKKENFAGAENGDKVVVKITAYPTKKSKAEGIITQIVARKNDPEAVIKAMIKAKGLTEEFPREVLAQAKMIQDISPRELEGRVDLRDKEIVTIDGPHSKDLDDAVSVEMTQSGNYLLGVHIADVSHYVTEDSPLDLEALKRGNSVYLINKVIPMLPPKLSNGICSLNPGVDRLTLTCQMEINHKGEIINHEIFPSVINSKARLVYDDVSDILERDDQNLMKDYPHLLLMKQLTNILRKRRKAQGGLDFDLPEAEILLDEQNAPIGVQVVERRIANIIIEEFMLAANRTIAEHFYWLGVPFVFRTHERPDRDKMTQLKVFLRMFGLNLKGKADDIYPSALKDIMEQVNGQSCETIINTVILKSMKKAFYSTQCDGHFGLSYQYYCHFTSPIRRYPDLIIHRIIKKVLAGEMDQKAVDNFEKKTIDAAQISSDTEKKAMELERDVEKYKKAEYIKNFVGRKYTGVISGVTEFGVYVQLENTIEGMARLDSFRDDYYIYDAKRYRIIGETTNNVYALGQKVVIKVKGATPEAGQIDFEIVRKI